MRALGPTESAKIASSDTVAVSRCSYYNSASEIIGQLRSMMSLDPNDFSYASVSQDALAGRLHLASKKLYGRKKEQAMLLKAYKRVIVNSDECNVVLVSGFSGAGKTTLVEETARPYLMSNGGYFLHVKCDVYHRR
eukprot:12997343-Ditylum_brightwellii.AAC.1